MHLYVLPTKTFLAHRGVIDSSDIYCSFCKVFEETTNHILCECKFASEVWSKIFEWWQVKRSTYFTLSLQELWHTLMGCKSKKVKAAWKLVVSATLWTLWLARNKYIFEGSSLNAEELLAISKVQAKEWCLAFNLIHKSLAAFWNSNPIGSATSSVNRQLKEIIKSATALVGFIDGSWKANKAANCAGMGGLIQDQNGSVIFTFSGPLKVESSFEAEMKALFYLMESYNKSRWKEHALVVYSDCKNLVSKFLEWQVYSKDSSDLEFSNLACVGKLKLKYLPSDINIEADRLAKEGALRKYLVQHWI